MAAQITFNQTLGAGPGTPGQARNDIWLGAAVQLVSSGSGSSWLWEMLDKPAGSTATIASPTASVTVFTPDLLGTYRIRLTVDGGGTGNVTTLVVRARYDGSGILFKRGWALPAVEEYDDENNYGGNTRGWSEVWEGVLPEISAALTHLVYRPLGGVDAGHVFQDWETLMKTFATIEGLVVIEIDDSVTSPAIIPAGTWGLDGRAILAGRGTSPRPALRFANSVTVQNPMGLRRLDVNVTGTDVGAIDMAAGTSLIVEDCGLTNGSSAGPLLSLDNMQLVLRGYSVASPLTSQPVFLFGLGSTSIRVEDASSIATDSMAGTPAGVTVDLIGVSASCSSTQTGLGGPLTINAPSVPEPYTFIYRPSYAGPSQPNIYTSWSALMTALAAVDGPKEVQFDNTDAAITIPSGTHDFGYETTLRGIATGEISTGVVVTLQNGAIFKDVYALDQGIIIRSVSSAACFTWTGFGTGNPRVLHMDNQAEISTVGATVSPISLGDSDILIISMKRGSLLRRDTTVEVVELTHANAELFVYLFDEAANIGDVFDASLGAATIYLVSSAAVFNHTASANLTVERLGNRRWVYPMAKGNITDATGTPVVAGAAYVDPSELPSYHFLTPGLTAKFRVVIETTAPGQAAVVDLFDVNGVFNAGVPAPVSGSQQDTATGTAPSRPFGGTPVTPNPLVASAYEVDLSSVFVGGTWSGAGVFETRLWITSAGGGNVATCKSAELIFEW